MLNTNPFFSLGIPLIWLWIFTLVPESGIPKQLLCNSSFAQMLVQHCHIYCRWRSILPSAEFIAWSTALHWLQRSALLLEKYMNTSMKNGSFFIKEVNVTQSANTITNNVLNSLSLWVNRMELLLQSLIAEFGA